MALPILLLSPLFSVQLEEPQEHGRQLSHTFEVRKIGCATNTVEVKFLYESIPLPIQCGFHACQSHNRNAIDSLLDIVVEPCLGGPYVQCVLVLCPLRSEV